VSGKSRTTGDGGTGAEIGLVFAIGEGIVGATFGRMGSDSRRIPLRLQPNEPSTIANTSNWRMYRLLRENSQSFRHDSGFWQLRQPEPQIETNAERERFFSEGPDRIVETGYPKKEDSHSWLSFASVTQKTLCG